MSAGPGSGQRPGGPGPDGVGSGSRGGAGAGEAGGGGAGAGGGEGGDVRDLLAPYALDAVDDLERRAVERLVARDPEAAAELAELRATVAALGAASAAPAPAGARADVLAAVALTAQDRPAPTLSTDDAADRGPGTTADPAADAARGGTPRVPADGTTGVVDDGTADGVAAVPSDGTSDGVVRPLADRRRGSRPSQRWLLAAAAAAVVALAVPSSLAWQERERAVVAEQRAAELADLLAAPGTEVVRADVEGGGTAVAVLGTDGAVLVADGLPELDDDRTYQLWAMRDGVPVPAGLFEPASGSAQVQAEDYRPGDGLAVSVEPDGGSDQPTTTPVVVLLPT